MNLNGYSLTLTHERERVFLGCVDEDRTFAQPVPEFSYSAGRPLLCFVGTKDKGITHLGIGRHSMGVKPGTNLSRLSIDTIIELEQPVTYERIIEILPARTRHWASEKFAKGGLLPQKSFEHVVEAIYQLSPESHEFIERFRYVRQERISLLPKKTQESLAQQKEAVMTALAIAEMDRKKFSSWTPPSTGTPNSFLDGLPNLRVREDQMIINDMMKVPGFELVRSMPHSTAVFESGNERLTVVLVNRTVLEEQTGTDLIYYNETFKAFVMIQYKAMELDGSEHIFRLPNAQLEIEVSRMNKLLSDFQTLTPNDSSDGFRLNENPFYLKFCPRIIFDPDTVDLVPGMYLPLDYWKFLETHSNLTGTRGGRRLTYDNVGRHINNTEFINLVSKAWIGTNINQSGILLPIIREAIETGKAVVIAVKTNVQEPIETLPN